MSEDQAMTASKAGETPTLAENVHRAFTECNHLRIENAELLDSIETLQAKLSAAELDAGRYRGKRKRAYIRHKSQSSEVDWNQLYDDVCDDEAEEAALRRSAP